jgi:hypothetical protein
MSESVLDQDHEEAKEFFFRDEAYCNFDVPKYFTFTNLLSQISSIIENGNFKDYWDDETSPHELEGVNYKLLRNKGEYSWRALELIHPVLYVELVHRITDKDNWEQIRNRLKDVQDTTDISCMSIPVYNEKPNKRKQIENWWKRVEQESIKLSLEYENIIHADISEFYNSIYTHSIPWALHGKEHSKDNKFNDDLTGNKIDQALRYMSYGETNGIPQGSIIMDFIAEIVLHYVDEKLHEKVNQTDQEYEIIRYRDDYRIFVNDLNFGNQITKHLTNVLSGMGLKLNDQKSSHSSDVVQGSVKKEKRYNFSHGKSFDNLRKKIYSIKLFADEHPNSGELKKKLDDYLKTIDKQDITDITEDLEVIISILVNIAYKNSRTYSIAVAIISKLISGVDNREEQESLIMKIKEKFNRIPNTGLMNLWLQRFTVKLDRQIEYKEPICKVVQDESNGDPWKNDWIGSTDLMNALENISIVDREQIEKMDPVISTEEVSVFPY